MIERVLGREKSKVGSKKGEAQVKIADFYNVSFRSALWGYKGKYTMFLFLVLPI